MTDVANTVLGFTQTLGFGVKGWTGLAIGAGAAQAILSIFFPAAQDATLTAIHDSEEAITDAINAEGQAILSGVWDMFAKQYLANVTTAQQTFGTIYAGFKALPSDALESTDDPVDATIASGNLDTWKSSIDGVTGATSSLLTACNFVIDQEDKRNLTIHLYLLAATVYLNYCKLGLMVSYTRLVAAYPSLLATYKTDHPDWETHQDKLPILPMSFGDLTTDAYYSLMVQRLPEFLGYAKPLVDSLTSHLAAKSAAVEKRARDFELRSDGHGKWCYVDTRTKATSAWTDQVTASTGMQLEIGIAQDLERAAQDALYGMAGVDPDEVALAAKAIDALVRTKNEYANPGS